MQSFLCFVALCAAVPVLSESCTPDSVGGSLVTDANFAALTGCTFFEGELIFDGRNVSESNARLAAQTLQHVDVLKIQYIPWSNLSVFQGLQTCGALSLTNCSQLPNLQGLDSLTALDNELFLQGNDIMVDLQGLNAGIQSISNIYALGLPLLTSLAGLDNLLQSDFVRVQYCGSLVNLQGLGSLTRLNFLDVAHNHHVQSLEGIETLTSIEGIYIEDESLTNLHGLESITSGGSFFIADLPSLVSIAEINNFVSFSNGVSFIRVPMLTNLDGFACQTERLTLVDTGLSDLSTLGLSTIFSMDIVKNSQLTSLYGMPAVTGYFIVQLNPLLTAVHVSSDFGTSLQSILIEGNNALETISGFSATTHSRVFHITNNNHLANVSLSSLGNVSLHFSISKNPLLTALELPSLFNSRQVDFTQNPALPCQKLVDVMQRISTDSELPTSIAGCLGSYTLSSSGSSLFSTGAASTGSADTSSSTGHSNANGARGVTSPSVLSIHALSISAPWQLACISAVVAVLGSKLS